MGALLQANATTFRAPAPVSAQRSLQLTVMNGAVIVQLGHGVGGIQWDDDSFRLPGVHVIPGPVDAVRVRAAVSHAGTARDPWPVYSLEGY